MLFPRPRELQAPPGGFSLPAEPTIGLDGPSPEAAAVERLQSELSQLGRQSGLAVGEAADVRLRLAPAVDLGEEGYRLEVGEGGIAITSPGEAGLYYGVATLVQWLRLHLWPGEAGCGRLPALLAVDRPDFRHRGVLLDISRDKVPKLATLLELVELLAGWKVNQLQLYMEHTFAYRGHETVWRDASPMSPEEIRRLDAHCRRHFIELVPNQNSFGHFHRWLVHAPYRRLAECPEGIEHPFSPVPEPFSLCPTDPGSLELLADLYDQLLPCFTSRLFNVGLDETLDLGRGRSAEACRERGRERVYLDFVRGVHRLVRQRGRRMQLWGDVILERPELVAELPPDVIALEWGHEADHPFAEDVRRFAASGLDFYVCPGTGAWSSFAGRATNALLNLASAARHGHAHGGLGYLVTDWGDHGHLQPLPVSTLGLLAGAGFAWNASTAEDPLSHPWPRLLDLHAFRDRAGVLGKAALKLGDAYRSTGAASRNGSALFFTLIFAAKPAAERRTEGMTAAHLERTLEQVAGAAALLADARPERADAALLVKEFRWVAEILGVACRLGSARLAIGDDRPLAELPQALRHELAAQLEGSIRGHRDIWLARNRPGGLEDSASRLRAVVRMLESA